MIEYLVVMPEGQTISLKSWNPVVRFESIFVDGVQYHVLEVHRRFEHVGNTAALYTEESPITLEVEKATKPK